MRDGSGLRLVAPKGGKGRTICLPTLAVEALKAHRARQAEQKLKAGSFYQDGGLVFACEVGTPLEPSNIDRRSFKPLLKKVGCTISVSTTYSTPAPRCYSPRG